MSFVSATIVVRDSYGTGGVIGYRSANDTVIINVLSTSNVSILNSSCPNINGTYVCQVKDNVDVQIAYYQVKNNNSETSLANIKVDNGIGQITYDLSRTRQDTMLSYSITDTGFNGNDACSGIKSIQVFDGQSAVNVIELNGRVGECSYSGSVNLSITQSGKREFYLKVTDNVLNVKSTPKQNITIDLSSPEIPNALIVRNAGLATEITTISNNAVIYLDLYFTVKDEELSKITVDLSSVTTNTALAYAYKNFNVPLTNCQVNLTTQGISGKNTYSCIIRNIPLRLSGSSLTINITATDKYGNTISVPITKSFSVDNTVPRASIKTDACDKKGRCYVKTGQNNIIIELNKQNFVQKGVYFTLSGSTFGTNRVQNCTGNICSAKVFLTCSGGEVEAKILSSSTDDFGNTLQEYTNTLYCDNTPPTIISSELKGDYVTDLLVSGKRITLIANIDELESDEITAYAKITDLTSPSKVDKLINDTEKGECKKTTNRNVTCTFVLDTVNDEKAHTVVIDVTATDVIGNNYTKKLPQKTILGFKDANATPQFLESRFVDIRPSEINRITLDLAQFNKINYYAYAQYKLNLKSGNNIKIIYQKLDITDCLYLVEGEDPASATEFFSEAKISNIYANTSQTNRIDFKFKSQINVNQIANSFKLSCNISTYVQEGNYLYVKPQILTLQIPLSMRNSKLDTPGEEFAKKIKETEDGVMNSTTYQLVKELDKAMSTVQRFCDLKRYIDYAQMGGVAMQTAGAAVNIFAPGIGDSLGYIGTQFDNTAQQLQTGYNPVRVSNADVGKGISELWGGIGQACFFVSCQLGYNQDATFDLDKPLRDSVVSATDSLPLGVGEELTSSLRSSNLKNSIVMSAAKLCLPGVIYNLNKYRQIDCEYLQCLKVYSATGLDVSQCDLVKSSKTCSIVVGEVFELPFARIGKNLFSNTADVIRYSYGSTFNGILKYVLDSPDCELLSKSTSQLDKTQAESVVKFSDWQIAKCRIPHAIQQYISFQKVSIKNDDFHYDQTRDYCESASCTGKDCFKQENTFGMNIPQLTMTEEQRNSLYFRRAFGTSSVDVTLDLMTDALKARTKEERNEKIARYNSEATSINAVMDDRGTTQRLPIFGDKPGEVSFNPEMSVDEGYTTIGTQMITINQQLNPQSVGGSLLTPVGAAQYAAQQNYNFENDQFNAEYGVLISLRQTNSNFKFTDISSAAALEAFKSSTVKDKTAAINSAKKVLGNDALVFLNYEEAYSYVSEHITDKDVDKKFYIYNDDGVLISITADEATKNGDLKDFVNSKDRSPVIKFTRDSTGKVVINCDNAGTEACKKILERNELIEKRRIELQKANFDLRKEKVQKQTDFGVRLFFDTFGMKKFLTSEYWDDAFGWKDSEYSPTRVAEALDPENWKNNLCNPDSGVLLGGSSVPDGSVYQCNSQSEGCKLVLSYGAERVEYNSTHYIYTISYILGPVSKDTEFNILFRGSNIGTNTIKGFKNNVVLPNGQVAQKAKVVVLSQKYDRMCFQFTQLFPEPGTMFDREGKLEYCRDIKDNIFKTGNPYTEADLTAAGIGDYGSSSTPGSGSRPRPTNTQAGFLE